MGDARRPEAAPNGVSAQRQRQPPRRQRPALSEIAHGSEPLASVRESALVDDQRGIDFAGTDGVECARVGGNGHDDRLELGQQQPQHDVRRGPQAGNSDAPAAERLELARLPSDDDGAVTATDRHAVRQQQVVSSDRGPPCDGHRQHVDVGRGGASVEGFRVGPLGFEDEVLGIDLAREQRPKHEQVVAVRRERESNASRRGGHGQQSVARS